MALTAFLVVSAVLLLVAWIVTRPSPQLISNQPPVLPRDYPVTCVECGRVHDGECLNYAIWVEEGL